MSVQNDIYIGPCVEVCVKVISIKMDNCRKIDSCINPQKGFCSECGISVAKRFSEKEIEEPSINFYDLFKHDEMTMSSVMSTPRTIIINNEKIRFYYYLPNRVVTSKIGGYLEDEGISTVEDWSDLDMKQEIIDFEKEYEKEIEKLKETYGKTEIKFCYLQFGS